MKKAKLGIFSNLAPKPETPIMDAPWQQVLGLLVSLPPGGKLPVPSKKSEYLKIKKDLLNRDDEKAKNAVEFIDFILKHESLGNVEFAPEPN